MIKASSCEQLIHQLRNAMDNWSRVSKFIFRDSGSPWSPLDHDSFQTLPENLFVAPSQDRLSDWGKLGSESYLATSCMLIDDFQKKHSLAPLLSNDGYLTTQVMSLLSQMEPEFWSFEGMSHHERMYGARNYLHHYLHYTFLRLLHEKKVWGLCDAENADKPFILVWHTGLMHQSRRTSMICLMIRSDIYEDNGNGASNNPFSSSSYTLYSFWEGTNFGKMMYKCKEHLSKSVPQYVHEALDKLRMEDVKPAFYFNVSHESEKYFNPTLEVDVRSEYMLDNKHRLEPKSLVSGKSDNEMLAILEKASGMAIDYARLNFRVAVPQYYAEHNKGDNGTIQWVLPLSLDLNNPLEPHCGLVLKYDSVVNKYVAVTALDRDLVLKNTRLVHRLHMDWQFALWKSERAHLKKINGESSKEGKVGKTKEPSLNDKATASPQPQKKSEIASTNKFAPLMAEEPEKQTSSQTPDGTSELRSITKKKHRQLTTIVVKNFDQAGMSVAQFKQHLKTQFSIFGPVSSVVPHWNMVFVNMKDKEGVDTCMSHVENGTLDPSFEGLVLERKN